MSINRSDISRFIIATAILGPALSYYKLYAFHLVLLLGVLYWLKSRLMVSLSIVPFLTLFGINVTSILWTIHYDYTVLNIFITLNGVLLSLFVSNYITDFSSFKDSFRFTQQLIVLQILVSLLEAFTSFRLPTSPYSKYAGYFGKLSADFDALSNNATAYLQSSPTGFSGNPNNLALILSIAIPFAWFHKKRLISLLGTSLIISLIILTGSRIALLSIFIGLFASLFFWSRKLFFSSIIIVTISLTSIFTFAEKLSNSETQKLAEIGSVILVLKEIDFSLLTESKGSLGTRIQLITNGLEGLKGFYLTGVGAGASKYIQEQKGTNNNVTSMHNFWIEILVEYGIPYFIFFVSIYLSHMFQLFNRINLYSKDVNYFTRSFFISTLIFIPASIGPSSILYNLTIWLYFSLSYNFIRVLRNDNTIPGRY